MSYAIEYQGRAYGPDGLIEGVGGTPLGAGGVEEYNKAVEAAELAHIKTGPEHIYCYARKVDKPKWGHSGWELTIWTGVVICECAWMTERRYMGFNGGYRKGTYRRAVTATIGGVLYHGWFMESSGDYVRLKRAKKQPVRKGEGVRV